MTEFCIEAENLVKRFGSVTAVDHLSLQIPTGKIFGFLGPNGAGKSTTIRMLTGLLLPTSGRIRVLDYELPREAEKIRLQLGYMTQKFSLYTDLTVMENLRFVAKIVGFPQREQKNRIEALLSDHHLEKIKHSYAQVLSGGQRQRLALAAATLNQPPILFLDEPTSGVDPENRRDFWEKLFDLTDQGTTILVSTHYMDEAERCHQLALIDKGVLQAADSPRNLMQQMNVVDIDGDDLRQFKHTILATRGVLSAAQQGLSLRVLVESTIAEPDQWLTQQLGEAGHGYSISRVSPSLEDVFVYYTQQGGEA